MSALGIRKAPDYEVTCMDTKIPVAIFFEIQMCLLFFALTNMPILADIPNATLESLTFWKVPTTVGTNYIPTHKSAMNYDLG